MKFRDFVGGAGIILMWLTFAILFLIGTIGMYAMWNLAGLVVAIMVFPLPVLFGLWATCFTSWSSFIGAVIWFALLVLMINYGDNYDS